MDVHFDPLCLGKWVTNFSNRKIFGTLEIFFLLYTKQKYPEEYTHFQGNCCTQVSFEIFIQEAWKSQMDFKWSWLSISTKYSILKGVNFLTKTLSLKCMSTSIYNCVLKCPPISVWNQHTEMCLHLNTEWGHLKYLSDWAKYSHNSLDILCSNVWFIDKQAKT